MTTPAPSDWVLVLDDDPWALEITRVMLEANGIPVHASQTLETALDAVGRIGPPAVILLDVMMPGVNGFDVCRRLRAEGSLRHTRVVFVTSLDDEASHLAALDAGADDLIAKPFQESILVARIRSLIQLARLRDRDQARLEYEAVLDSIGEGVVTLDDADLVLTANRPARRLLGLPDNPPEPIHLPTFVERHWSVETGATGRSTQARLVWRDIRQGVGAALDWTSRELPRSADTHASWTVVVRDATDAWEGDRALGRLTRALSHKLRIPLTGLSTSLDLLAEASDLDEVGRELVEIAGRSADRLNETLVRILEFTQATAPGPGSPRSDLLHPDQVRTKLGLDDDIELAVAVPDPVRLDVGLVGRCVAELAANARRAGARQLSLTIESDPDGCVVFALTDDGPGLPRGTAARIFEPFYQVDRSGEAAGAGLGLAILAAEVEARGGTVGASAPVKGPTTVWFRLPETSILPRPAPAD